MTVFLYVYDTEDSVVEAMELIKKHSFEELGLEQLEIKICSKKLFMSVNHEQFFIAYNNGGDAYEGEEFIKIHYKTMKGENLWKKKKKQSWI